MKFFSIRLFYTGHSLHVWSTVTDVCSAIPFSKCNTATGACECVSGQIGSSCFNGYILDGSQISPFLQLPNTPVQFIPTTGPDTATDDIPFNNKYLLAQGSVSFDRLWSLYLL